jgi:hypothetical protein
MGGSTDGIVGLYLGYIKLFRRNLSRRQNGSQLDERNHENSAGCLPQHCHTNKQHTLGDQLATKGKENTSSCDRNLSSFRFLLSIVQVFYILLHLARKVWPFPAAPEDLFLISTSPLLCCSVLSVQPKTIALQITEGKRGGRGGGGGWETQALRERVHDMAKGELPNGEFFSFLFLLISSFRSFLFASVSGGKMM